MIFQDYRLLHDRTVFDNVALPLVVAGMGHAEINRRVRAALDKVGLLRKERVFPITLSGGEQQRVGIARALVSKPPVLLADEPTGNLDSRTSVEIMEILQRLNRERGLTVVLITHEHDIAEYGRRTITFKDGHVVSDGPPERQRDAAAELAALPPPEELED